VQEAMEEYKLSRKAVFEVVRRFKRRMSGRKQTLCR
jgi:Mor family transcriptional regulator